MKEQIEGAIRFFKDAYIELGKVTWLSRKEVIASTIVVIILVIIVAIYVGTLDFILSRVLAIIL